MRKSYTIRSYTAEDIPEIIECAKTMTQKPRQGQLPRFSAIAFNEEKVYNKLVYYEKNAQFFTSLVIDTDNKIIGVLSALICEYFFSDERLAADQFFFFDEERTNVSALKDLIKSYVDWAKEHEVREALLRTSSGYKLDKFAVLMKRLNFSQFEAGFSKEF